MQVGGVGLCLSPHETWKPGHGKEAEGRFHVCLVCSFNPAEGSGVACRIEEDGDVEEVVDALEFGSNELASAVSNKGANEVAALRPDVGVKAREDEVGVGFVAEVFLVLEAGGALVETYGELVAAIAGFELAFKVDLPLGKYPWVGDCGVCC